MHARAPAAVWRPGPHREPAPAPGDVGSHPSCTHTFTHVPLQLCGALGRIKSLRQHLREVDDHTYASACTVASLQQRRSNISATLDVLQVGVVGCALQVAGLVHRNRCGCCCTAAPACVGC